MADVTQNDNDRATAIQIAGAHSGASTQIATIEAQAQYAVASAQIIEIQSLAIDQVQFISNSADAQAFEVLATGDIGAEVTYYEAFNTANETYVAARYDVIAIGQLASVESNATKDEAYAQSAAAYGESSARVRATAQDASIQASTTIAEAYLSAANISAETESSAQEIIGTSAARVSEITRVAASEVDEIEEIAEIEAATTGYTSASAAFASLAISTLDASTAITIANTQASDQNYTATNQSLALHADADSKSRLDRSGATQDHDSSITVATTRMTADEYAADGRYGGVVAHEDGTDRRLLRKLNFAQSKFDEVFPYVSGSLASWQSAHAPQSPGLATSYPKTPIRGVFTPRLIQMQANTSYAGAASGFASSFREAQSDVASRGLSGNSPFLDAIRAGMFSRSVRESNRASASARFQAAKANADRELESQKLRGLTFTDENRVALESESVGIQRQVGLLKAEADIVSGLS